MMREILSHPFWDSLTIAAAGVGFLAAVLFVGRYQRDEDFGWWKNSDGSPNLFGRFLMIRKILLSLLFALIILNRIFPGWTGREAVTAILFTAFAVHTFVPYRLLTEAQKERREMSKRE
jgi:hypothetical protein